MKRVICSGVVVVLAVLMATSTQSQTQTQRPRVRATRRVQMPAEVRIDSGMMDPNVDPMQRQAERRRDFQQRIAEMQQRAAEMQRLAEESRNNAIRQTLNATDEQWQRIEPRLDQIDRLKAEATVSASPGSSGGTGGMTSFQRSTADGTVAGFGGGWGFGGATVAGPAGRPQTWTFGSHSPGQSAGEPTDGQTLCEQLLQDIQNAGTPPADVAQRIAELRRIRAQAQQNLARARTDLRALIAPAQEPALILMGYLE
jgi:hypothetical protein